MTGLLLLMIGGVVLTIGDVLMKKWVLTSDWLMFSAGMALYTIGMLFLAFSFKYKNIAVASMLFVLFNIITLLAVSWLYFNEPITKTQAGGIILGLLAVALLEHGETV